jgi:hypothetical protein
MLEAPVVESQQRALVQQVLLERTQQRVTLWEQPLHQLEFCPAENHRQRALQLRHPESELRPEVIRLRVLLRLA